MYWCFSKNEPFASEIMMTVFLVPHITGMMHLRVNITSNTVHGANKSLA